MLVDGYDLQTMSFVAPAIVADWGIARADLIWVLNGSLIGMAIGSVVLGRLGDRVGRKRAFIACLSVPGRRLAAERPCHRPRRVIPVAYRHRHRTRRADAAGRDIHLRVDAAPGTQYRRRLRRGVRAAGWNAGCHDRATCDPIVRLACDLLDRHRAAAVVRGSGRVAAAGVTAIPGAESGARRSVWRRCSTACCESRDLWATSAFTWPNRQRPRATGSASSSAANTATRRCCCGPPSPSTPSASTPMRTGCPRVLTAAGFTQIGGTASSTSTSISAASSAQSAVRS